MVKSFVFLVEVIENEYHNLVIVFRSTDGKPLATASNFEDVADVLCEMLHSNSAEK